MKVKFISRNTDSLVSCWQPNRVRANDWIWIIGLCGLRLAVGAPYGLGGDEAHYALYGMRPALSYFDHPPLIGWIQFVFLSVFGNSELTARIPAALCWVITSVLGIRLAIQVSGSTVAARVAVVALNLSFVPMALGWMFVPETLLLPLGLWLVQILVQLVQRPTLKSWVWLGICLGLCGLTKYTAFLFCLSVLGVFVAEKKKIPLKGLLLSSLIAAVLISPVILWNAQNSWLSFKYQTHHVLGNGTMNLGLLIRSWGIQFLAYSPFLVLGAGGGLILFRNKWNLQSRVALWLAAPVFLFFSISGLGALVLPHWTLIGFAFACLLGISLGWNHPTFRKWLSGAIGVTGIASVILALEFVFHFIPFSDFKTPYFDLVGWRELKPVIAEIKTKHPSVAIGVSNWSLGSRAHYYLESVAPVFVLDTRLDQFDLWEKNQPQPSHFLMLQWRGFENDLSQCQKTQDLGEHVFKLGGAAVNSLRLVLCHGRRLHTSG